MVGCWKWVTTVSTSQFHNYLWPLFFMKQVLLFFSILFTWLLLCTASAVFLCVGTYVVASQRQKQLTKAGTQPFAHEFLRSCVNQWVEENTDETNDACHTPNSVAKFIRLSEKFLQHQTFSYELVLTSCVGWITSYVQIRFRKASLHAPVSFNIRLLDIWRLKK